MFSFRRSYNLFVPLHSARHLASYQHTMQAINFFCLQLPQWYNQINLFRLPYSTFMRTLEFNIAPDYYIFMYSSEMSHSILNHLHLMNPSSSKKKFVYVRSIMLVIKPAYIKTRIFIKPKIMTHHVVSFWSATVEISKTRSSTKYVINHNKSRSLRR